MKRALRRLVELGFSPPLHAIEQTRYGRRRVDGVARPYRVACDFSEDAALAELPTLPSTDGIEGLGGSFGSGDGLSRDSESTLERSSSLSSRGTKPLEVQRGLSATGRVPRVASAELEAFVEAGVAPPTHPRRPRVVRFNSVVDDSEPETPPLGS